MRSFPLFSLGCGVLVLTLMASFRPEAVRSFQEPQNPANAPRNLNPAGGDYIGAKVCNNCHKGEDKGDAHAIWEKSAHAKAWETLGTEEAKKVGAKHGVKDPQTDAKCLKCHATAYGFDPKIIKKSLKVQDGVQCESCHGPAGEHKGKRMKEAMKKGVEPSPIAAGEITKARSMETCGQCHNESSPTYKPFCLMERMKVIEHFDPRKGRSKEEIEKIRNSCTPDCKICKAKKEAEAKKESDGK